MAELTAEEFVQVLDIARLMQQLRAPELAQQKAQEDRAALLQRLQIKEAGKAPQATGLSDILKILGRFSTRRAELLEAVDPGDAEGLAEAEAQAALLGRPEAEALGNLAQTLAVAGDPGMAAFAASLTDILNPPSREELANRGLIESGRVSTARKAQVGGFSVTGGPRAGFAARGTPEEILAQLIETRPAELKAKFAQTQLPRPVRGPGPPTAVAAPAPSFAPQFPALPPEAGFGEEPDLLLQLLRALSGAGTAPGQLGA